MPLIQPRTLKGFRDYPPEIMIPREGFLEKARQVYRSYGFAPIDTPADLRPCARTGIDGSGAS